MLNGDTNIGDWLCLLRSEIQSFHWSESQTFMRHKLYAVSQVLLLWLLTVSPVLSKHLSPQGMHLMTFPQVHDFSSEDFPLVPGTGTFLPWPSSSVMFISTKSHLGRKWYTIVYSIYHLEWKSERSLFSGQNIFLRET